MTGPEGLKALELLQEIPVDSLKWQQRFGSHNERRIPPLEPGGGLLTETFMQRSHLFSPHREPPGSWVTTEPFQ